MSQIDSPVSQLSWTHLSESIDSRQSISERYSGNAINWNTVYARIYPNVIFLQYCSHRTVEANWAATSEAKGRSLRHEVYRIAFVTNKIPQVIPLREVNQEGHTHSV